MVKRFIIDVDPDDKHVLDAAGYDAPVTRAQVTAEALGDLLSVLDSSTTENYEDVMPEEGIRLTHALWGLLAALCFVAGLSIGFSLYFRSSLSLYIEDYLRRCCPRRIRGRTAGDPVLLTVVDRKSKESVKDGEEGTDNDNEDSKANTTVNSPQAKGDGASAEKEGEEAEAKDDGKTEGEGNCKEEHGKSSSSSSSEGEDDEGSVRQRKKAAAEGTDEGEAAPETEDKGEDEQHKE